jgi:hypothetical protein
MICQIQQEFEQECENYDSDDDAPWIQVKFFSSNTTIREYLRCFGYEHDVKSKSDMAGFGITPKTKFCQINIKDPKKKSKKEELFIEYLGKILSNIKPQHKIKCNDKCYYVDGYHSEHNLVIEFFGDYWHGNLSKYKENDMHPQTGKTFGEMNKEVLERIKNIRDNGYHMIYIWESDFDKLSKNEKFFITYMHDIISKEVKL